MKTPTSSNLPIKRTASEMDSSSDSSRQPPASRARTDNYQSLTPQQNLQERSALFQAAAENAPQPPELLLDDLMFSLDPAIEIPGAENRLQVQLSELQQIMDNEDVILPDIEFEPEEFYAPAPEENIDSITQEELDKQIATAIQEEEDFRLAQQLARELEDDAVEDIPDPSEKKESLALFKNKLSYCRNQIKQFFDDNNIAPEFRENIVDTIFKTVNAFLISQGPEGNDIFDVGENDPDSDEENPGQVIQQNYINLSNNEGIHELQNTVNQTIASQFVDNDNSEETHVSSTMRGVPVETQIGLNYNDVPSLSFNQVSTLTNLIQSAFDTYELQMDSRNGDMDPDELEILMSFMDGV